MIKSKIKVSVYPTQSTDLNPIENLWVNKKKKAGERNLSNLKEREIITREEWSKI